MSFMKTDGKPMSARDEATMSTRDEATMSTPSAYLLAGQQSELDRLQLQSRTWEPAGEDLLRRIESPKAANVLEIGCGAMGWLRILSRWVGEEGRVVGTDIDDKMLAVAKRLVEEDRLSNVSVVRDDLFATHLTVGSFDLLHARFQIAPLGRGEQQLSAFLPLIKPGGWIALEEPDSGSWHYTPDAPAANRLIGWIRRGFQTAGGDFDAGRSLYSLMANVGLKPRIEARVIALEPGHPYLRLPMQFATSLRPRLEAFVAPADLDQTLTEAARELDRPGTWGTTFTLIQAIAQISR